MKRRELFKVAGIGAFSLTGLERLAKAMTWSEYVIACAEGVDDRCRSETFVCGDNEQVFICERFSCRYFRCEEGTDEEGDFVCRMDYVGCNSPGVFRCVDRDEGDNPQFVCQGNFDGCAGDEGVFACEDFRCQVSYQCGRDNFCRTRYPYDCQPATGAYTA